MTLNLPQSDAVGFVRMKVGGLTLTILSDGSAGFEPGLYAVGEDESDVAAQLAADNIPNSTVNSFANLLLVEGIPDRVLLVDSGWGGFRMPGGVANTGRLVPTLEMLGINPLDVTDLLLTHFHPDHVSGAVDENSAPTFPNATVHFPEADRVFIHSEDVPEPLVPFTSHAVDVLDALTDAGITVNTFDGSVEGGANLIPGITALHAPGHTPGHHTLRIEDGGETLYHMVDIANHFTLSLSHPTWVFGIDTVPEEAVETRQRLLGELADAGTRVMAYHFPFPGVGTISRDSAGFRFTPLL